jgi:hypothetical protein
MEIIIENGSSITSLEGCLRESETVQQVRGSKESISVLTEDAISRFEANRTKWCRIDFGHMRSSEKPLINGAYAPKRGVFVPIAVDESVRAGVLVIDETA